jgi:uncharacterized protein involved in oxidation of intracellular sulfur
MRCRRRRETVRGDVKKLVLLNDAVYGTERSYNGLRLAHSIASETARGCGSSRSPTPSAAAGQQTPNGYYNLERMLAAAIQRGAEERTDWTLWADKIVSF